MSGITKEQVLLALSKVQDPELHRDLVSLNMIQDVVISGSEVSFTVMLTTPACPLKTRIEQDSRSAVLAVPGVTRVQIKMSANVPSDGRSRGLVELPIRNAIAVGSGKGGVGKTTVAVNTAIVLAQMGARVGLLDADIYGPNVPMMMGVAHLPPPKENKLVPAEAYGVKVMSIGFLVKPDQPLIWRGPMLHSAIRQFLTDVDWGELDYLIVDLPPGTGDAALSLAQSLPLSGGVIVTLPQQVSLDDARRGLEMFRQLEVPVLGVVENMSFLELPDGTRMDIFGSGGGERLAKESGAPFLGSIPIDPTVRSGGDTGEPVTAVTPDSPVAKALCSVGMEIAARVSIEAMKNNDHPISLNVIG
jgi:ATP-binding protein involved in chromosome partitioning